jgi:hypothetical protein
MARPTLHRGGLEGLLSEAEWEGKRSKVPVWARNEMDLARRRLGEQEERWRRFVAARSAAAAPHSDTRVNPHYDERSYPLPSGTRIEFDLDGDTVTAWVVREGVAAELRLMLTDGQIMVKPRQSNVIEVVRGKR